MIIRFLALISLTLITFGSISANGESYSRERSIPATLGWGFEVGRATETDVEELLADQLKLRREFERMGRVGQAVLGKERVKALLGDSTRSDETLRELMKKIDVWWAKEIDGPIIRIANNPAASCEEASDMVRIVLGRNREKALLGANDDSMDFMFRVFSDVQNRCHEEALDECNATGRHDHVIRLMMAEGTMAASLGIGGDGSWIGPVLKECAIYELHYVSTTDIDDEFKLHSVIDGRIKLKPVIEGDTGLKIMSNLKFEGEASSGTNPFLQKLECSAPDATVTCSLGGDPKKSAYAKIAKMTLRSKEFYVDERGTSQSRPVGEDLLELIFSPAMISATATIKMPDLPPINLPFLEVGATGFVIAHQKSKVEEGMFKFTENRRTGYPILFEFTRQGKGVGEDVPGSDSTVLQLIHKPEKKPFEPRSKTPVRVPLKPKPKP